MRSATGLGDGARGDRSAGETARGDGRRLLEGDPRRHHLQPARTWPDRSRRFSDPSLGSRPTQRGLASDGSRRALKGDARRPADQPARRQHSWLPVPISRRSCRRCFLQGQKWPLPSGVDLWRSRRHEDSGSFCQRRRAARAGGGRGPINSRPRRPGWLPRHRFGVRGRQAAAPGCRPGHRRRLDERRAGVRIRPPAQGRRALPSRTDVGGNWHRRSLRQLSRGAAELSRRNATSIRRASGAGRRAQGIERGARGAGSSAEGVAISPRTPASRTRADEFAARGAGAAAREPTGRSRACERDRAAQGSRTRAGKPVQIRFPREHVARTQDAPELAADPRKAPRRQ